MSEERQFDYNKIALHVYENFADHEKQIKQNCVKSSIVAISAFYDALKTEINDIKKQEPDLQAETTVEDFNELLKVFEEYPANLQKPIKKPPAKELQRSNSRSNSSMNIHSNSMVNLSSGCIAEKSKTEVSFATASETYTDFRNFQQKLQQLISALQQNTLSHDYEAKLRQLNTFAQQLEKILPSDMSGQQTFAPEHEETLRNVLCNIEEMNYIQKNRNVFADVAGPNVSSGFMARLEGIMEVLMYTLASISANGI